MTLGWREELASLEVSNVFIYVGDAVRWDYTPEEVIEEGISFKSIAASIHSPTSFASLVTGLHPPRHGVYSFTDQLPEGQETILELSDLETRFVNSVRDTHTFEDPIFSVLKTRLPDVDSPFEKIDRPFLLVERGPGGHAPYGDFDGNAWEYFEARSKESSADIQSEYKQSVEEDADLFYRRLNELGEMGVLDDTLVVYTSDHGELLGEHGILGHNAPTRPELVQVPTVFIHSELSNTRIADGIFRHVDLVPTLLDVMGKETWDVDGSSLLQLEEWRPGFSFYRGPYPTGRIPGFGGELVYEGVWDGHGGHVFTSTDLLERMAILAGKLVKSPKRGYLRRNLNKAFRSFRVGNTTYGEPSFTVSEARTWLDEILSRSVESSEMKLSRGAKEQLRDLGYVP